MEMEEAKMEILTSNYTRQYPRSNARSRYRRSVGKASVMRNSDYTRKSGSAKEKTPRTFKERIVLQATICGGILAILLFFNIIDTGFTNSVTSWIDRNISFNMLAEEGGIGGWMDSVLSIFRDDDIVDDAIMPYFEVHNERSGTNVIPLQIETPPQANTIDSSRVDENILREINETVDVYYENNR